MKERPILFSAPMVRAILEGRKTQTRRALNQQPSNGWEIDTPYVLGRITSPHPKRMKFGVFIHRGLGTDFPECDIITNPYGQPGDRLWVRETWQGPLISTAVDYKKHNRGESINDPEHCVYRATDKLFAVDDDGKELGWRPSIHMPRWASRIDLEITGIRVELLQDISEEDAVAEGIDAALCEQFTTKAPTRHELKPAALHAYAGLWESINGPGSWNANPRVWVVEFKRVLP